jgi:hypothetical protein
VSSVINDTGIEYTSNKFIKSGRNVIILSSFLLRMLLLATIFYLSVAGSFSASAMFAVGVVLQRLWFMSKSKAFIYKSKIAKQLGV